MSKIIFMDRLPELATPNDEELNLFHMTHMGNLRSIFEAGYLYSNHAMRKNGVQTCYSGGACNDNVRSERGSAIPGLLLGDFVVFFYATRTAMLESIAKGGSNYAHKESDMVYLVANLRKVREYAQGAGGVRWEASGRNCLSKTPGLSADVLFRDKDLASSLPLEEIRFEYPQYQNPNERSQRMAEFHLLEKMPTKLIDSIVVETPQVQKRVWQELGGLFRQENVSVRPEWYFGFDASTKSDK